MAKNKRIDKLKKSKSLKTKTTQIKSESNRPVFRFAFLVILGIFSAWVLVSSTYVGIPSDEPIDEAYGALALDYYKSFGKDTSYVDLTYNQITFPAQKYYGTGFEMPAAAVSAIFPAINKYKVRHFLVALSGILILLFTGLICRELAGWAAACIAIVLLAASPTVVGFMLFNSKDIPFALGFICSSFFFIRIARSFPEVNKTDLAGAVIGIAMTVSIRFGGLLILTYLPVLFFIKLLLEPSFRKKIRKHGRQKLFTPVLLLLLVLCSGTLLGLLFYPNFIEHPIRHCQESLQMIKNFPAKIMMLFEGELISSLDLPKGYLLKTFGMTVPLFLLLALLVSVFSSRSIFKSNIKSYFAFFGFASIFPVVYVLLGDSPIYNGWRHLLFIYPSLIVIASIGLTYFFLPFKKNMIKLIGLTTFVLLVAKPMLWEIKNAPYQYTYYNELAGGFSKAYENYDTDFQQLAVTEGFDWLLKNELAAIDNTKNKVKIISNNGNAINEFFDTSKLHVQVVHSGIRNWKNLDWDYAVLSTIFIPAIMRDAIFPPIDKDLLYTVAVDGKGIAYVVKRNDRSNLDGLEALKRRDHEEALRLLNQAVEYDPSNVNAWLNLAMAKSTYGQGAEVVQLVEKYHKVFPETPQSNQLLGLGHYYQRDFKKAGYYIKKAIAQNPREKSYYTNLITVYNAANEPQKAAAVRKRLETIAAKK